MAGQHQGMDRPVSVISAARCRQQSRWANDLLMIALQRERYIRMGSPTMGTIDTRLFKKGRGLKKQQDDSSVQEPQYGLQQTRQIQNIHH